MRSSIVSIHDDADVSVPAPTMGGHDDVVDAELAAMARRRSVLGDHETVEAGDVVRLRMVGPSLRFTKHDASLAVGLGLLDDVFEDALVGLRVGGESVVASSDGDVRVTIIASQHREVPDLTDDLVATSTSGRFASIDGFRAMRSAELHAARLAEHTEEAAWAVLDEVVRHSTVRYDTDEVEALVEQEFARCRALTTEQGLVFDDLTPEQLAERTSVETIAEFRTMVSDLARWRIATALIGARLLGEDVDDAGPDDLDRLVHEAISHHRRRIAERLTQAQGAQA